MARGPKNIHNSPGLASAQAILEKFKVPKMKAEKPVKVGSTTAGTPAQAEKKKRVLSPEHRAKNLANLAKAREAREAKKSGISSVAERETYGAGLGRQFKSMMRQHKKSLDPEHKQIVAEGAKSARADVKEMRDIAKGYTAVAKKHREEAKEATAMAKELRAKAKALTASTKGAKRAFHQLAGDHEFRAGIEYVE
jgi:hypothetical protein